MSDETTSQTNTEDVQDQPQIGVPADEQQDSGPAAIYEDTPEDKALKASEAKEDEEPPKEDEVEEESEETEDEADEESAGDDKDYDSLELPEGSQLKSEDVQRILEQSKQEGLSKEAAQKKVDEADGLIKSYSERTQQTHKAMVEQWAQDVKTDKEIGGEKYKESVELARRTVQKFGTKEFLQSLTDTGFGNHPEVIRTFARIGKQIQDDSLVTDGSQTHHKSKDLADVFYGNETQTN